MHLIADCCDHNAVSGIGDRVAETFPDIVDSEMQCIARMPAASCSQLVPQSKEVGEVLVGCRPHMHAPGMDVTGVERRAGRHQITPGAVGYWAAELYARAGCGAQGGDRTSLLRHLATTKAHTICDDNHARR